MGQSQEVLILLGCTPMGTKATTEPASGGLAVLQRVSLQDPRGGQSLGKATGLGDLPVPILKATLTLPGRTAPFRRP